MSVRCGNCLKKYSVDDIGGVVFNHMIMCNMLTDSLFVLFAILAIGIALGNVSIKGISLGSSGVLFVALLAGHYHLQVPEGVTTIGTALFVYCVGLGVGNRFFGSLRSQGGRLLLLSAVIVCTGWCITLLACRLLGIDYGVGAGVFAGACTSTPGLAAALEAAETAGQSSSPINIGYGVAYPFGVIGVVLFVQVLPKLLKKSLNEPGKQEQSNSDPNRIVTRVIRIQNNTLIGNNIMTAIENGLLQCRVTRVMKNDMLVPLNSEDVFEDNQQLFVVGALSLVERDAALLGHIEKDAPKSHRLKDEMAEVLILEPSLSNKTLRELNTLSNYGIVVSRITRLGNTFVPHGDTEIFRNDVLTIVGQPEDIKEFKILCKHRSSAINATDIFSLATGVALGIAVGKIELINGFSLGTAGGPLLVSLILGHLGHVGSVVGYMPRNTRVMVMEFALMLFLAGAGVNGGATLIETLREQGLTLCCIGILVTLLPLLIGYVLSRKFLGLSLAETLGGICGGMTSTPALGAITAQTDKQSPVIAYATAYPLALLLMTVLSKVLIMCGSLL